MKVFWSTLPERAIMGNPFRHFMMIAEEAGRLGYHYIPMLKMRTDIARDELVKEFLRQSNDPDDILIQLDCDHNHPSNILELLVSNNKPVCAANAFRSNPTNPLPCFWLKDTQGDLYIPREYEHGLIQVAVTGFGAVAIKRWVFDKLAQAGYDQMYFFYQYDSNGTRISDEIAFSQMCMACDIPVFVDTRIVTPHWFEGEIDESSYEQWRNEHPIKQHKVSVIIPQRGRLEKLEKCLWSLWQTAPEVEVILLADEDDDIGSVKLPPNFTEGDPTKRLGIYVCSDRLSAIYKWNYGLEIATGDVVVAAANDVEFKENWLKYALEALDQLGDGMVVFNDGFTDPKVSSPHFLMTREYIDKYNGGVLMPPVYQFQFPDVENRLRAQKLGRYGIADTSMVIHEHPLTNSSVQIDAIHKEGYLKSFAQDKALFEERRKNGFPIVWNNDKLYD